MHAKVFFDGSARHFLTGVFPMQVFWTTPCGLQNV